MTSLLLRQEEYVEEQQTVDSDVTESLPSSASADDSPYNIIRQPSPTNLPETQFNNNIQPACDYRDDDK